MKLLLSYIRLHYKSVLLFAAFLLIFAIVFRLAELPLDDVLYAALLCLVLGFIAAAFSFLRFRERHTAMREMINRISLGLDELPEPRNIMEEDYTALLDELYLCKYRAESDAAVKLGEMTEYYTLWAHQIKTPIAAMRLLLQGDERPEYTELSEQLFRIEQYVGMVLQYVRTEDPSSDFVIRVHRLDEIVRQSVRKFSRSFIRKHLSLEYEDLNTCVLTDEKWLCFVVEQVLSNAVKYTPEGGRISIYMHPSRPKTLVIEDTGIGIAPEDLPRIFDKGYTGYNGRADKKSTGVGLYLCRQALKKLSHTISAESEVGQGTRIYIGLQEIAVDHAD